MRRVNHSPVRKQERRTEAEERTTARAARSSTEQLELLTSRRGKSTKERRRLSKGSK